MLLRGNQINGGIVMEMIKESPEYVQTSLAGAICLGLERGRFYRGARCTCLNLLLTYRDGCRAACSYCGLARSRKVSGGKTFIRVKWPSYPLEEILERVKTKNHPFRRVCVSMITHPRCLVDTCAMMERFRSAGLPISGLLTPTAMRGKEDLLKIREAGADRVGIAIDTATEELFDRHRGSGVNGPHKWSRYWEAVADAVEVFGRYKVGVHLIVGLGETEEEMVRAIARAHRMGALTHLFSFFPESGSLLEELPQPLLGHYRRVQLARYLINEGIISDEGIGFSPEGRIIDYGIDIEPYLSSGLAFMTSGCPGEDGLLACNRPFGNERAGEPIRNYPFVPAEEDLEVIRSQLWEGVTDARA